MASIVRSAPQSLRTLSLIGGLPMLVPALLVLKVPFRVDRHD